MTGGAGEDEIAKAGCSIADIAAGMYAYTGVLSALHLRNKTGKGSRVDVSMLESLVEWMGFPLYYSYNGANPPPRAGASHATLADDQPEFRIFTMCDERTNLGHGNPL